MDVTEITKIRTFLKSIKHKYQVFTAPGVPKLDEDGNPVFVEDSLPIIVMLDNDHTADESIHPIIWDDVDQVLYFFKSNYDAATSSMVGRSAVKNPMILTMTDYTQIQAIRVICDRDAYDKYMTSLKNNPNISSQLDDRKISIIAKKFFDYTDAEKSIKEQNAPVNKDFSKPFEWEKNGLRKP